MQRAMSALRAEEVQGEVIDSEGGGVGEDQHVGKLNRGPLPAIGFAADYGHGGGALHGEGEEDHERERATEQSRPGRKLVMFITPGWPMLGLWGSEQDLHSVQQDFNILVAMTNAIHDARTVIYRLDPYEIGGVHAGPNDPFYYEEFLKPVTDPKKATFPYLGLGVFAVHSGGRVLVTGHDITGELHNALQDAGHYYEITYPAPPAGGPNQYHAIEVRVNQPGATAQTISGYYADPQLVGPQAVAKKH